MRARGLGAKLLALVAVTGLVASFHSIIFAYGRQIFSLSRAGYFPQWLSRTHHRRKTPHIALLVGAALFPLTWLIAALLAAWGGTFIAAGYPEIPYSPVLTAIVAFVLSAFGGLLVLHFRQLTTELARTLRVRLTLTRRKHAVEWLLEERAGLYERFLVLDRKLSEA